MGVGIALAAGVALAAGGAAMSANAASKSRKALSSTTGDWLPDISRYQDQYFQDLKRLSPEALDLEGTIGERRMSDALDRREQALPGIGKGISDSMSSIMSLLKGELPQGVLDAFSRSGGANAVGSGFGGSGVGFLNQGLFGARGALGGMQLGYGLLPALMGTIPNVAMPDFMGQIMNPSQRTATQLQVRGQNMGIATTVAGMPTSSQIWGNAMSAVGGQLIGGGMAGMGGGMGGMGAGASNPTAGFQGYGSNGAAGYSVPVTRSPYIGTGEGL